MLVAANLLQALFAPRLSTPQPATDATPFDLAALPPDTAASTAPIPSNVSAGAADKNDTPQAPANGSILQEVDPPPASDEAAEEGSDTPPGVAVDAAAVLPVPPVPVLPVARFSSASLPAQRSGSLEAAPEGATTFLPAEEEPPVDPLSGMAAEVRPIPMSPAVPPDAFPAAPVDTVPTGTAPVIPLPLRDRTPLGLPDLRPMPLVAPDPDPMPAQSTTAGLPSPDPAPVKPGGEPPGSKDIYHAEVDTGHPERPVMIPADMPPEALERSPEAPAVPAPGLDPTPDDLEAAPEPTRKQAEALVHAKVETLTRDTGPEDQGRVHVTLHRDGEEWRVVVSADNPATLDLMRRHADQLQQDLAQQGFAGAQLDFSDWSEPDRHEPPAEMAKEGSAPRVEMAHYSSSPHRPSSGLDLRL